MKSSSKTKGEMIPMLKQIVLEFPVELPEKVLQDKETLKKTKETMVLELLRKGEISQGKAAELLEISRDDLFDLMAKHNIPMANFSPEELERQLKKREEAKEKNNDWSKLAIISFAKDWENEKDAIYDNWQEHYHVSER